mmetsp:Transcript_21043/g.32100  ORF Transcript_21043/g.32100 Transcript_21043/m.32100 type:complete len:1001 (-) Transcript_21043:140-3142(-)|eukprot:CAMPEP_0196820684 /NCGR_PEP_ID=MMETSP1362-20130617/76308_1 /TAXON_ID=163516 /ORGANISM="Leptocylindrus danicus, Strain CCMP1856" /LENGTH=1000 /DNA_ID=CAMNT_0042199661 /DNA_START=94 /DNA_END=3096 /DNA_ORIENTATION=-
MDDNKNDGNDQLLPGGPQELTRATTRIVDNRSTLPSPPYTFGDGENAVGDSAKSGLDNDSGCDNGRVIGFSLSDGDQPLPVPPYKDAAAFHCNDYDGSGNSISRTSGFTLDELENFDPGKHAPPVKIRKEGTMSFFNGDKHQQRGGYNYSSADDEDEVEAFPNEVDDSESSNSKRETYDDFPLENEGTPGYQALQANADVEVSKLRKFARKIRLPTLVRTVEKARKAIPKTRKGQKAPFVPPSIIVLDNGIEAKVGDETEEKSFRTTWEHINERWTRKKSTEPRPRDRRESYVKGRVIHREHELYTLSIAMMIGLKTSIGRTNSVLWHDKNQKHKWLESDNFMEVVKYLFPPKGSDITPKHNLGHTFKFKDYSPFAFAYLRRMFGVNEFEFLQSICGNANFIQFMSNAKSGQFMFYSCDGKYMIKTITTTESKFLRRILPHYFRHCFQNPNTLISRFYGMYRVKMYHLERRVKFIIMNSVFDTDKYLHNFYDLKGSSLGREAAPTDAVKKDNDLRRELPQGAFVMPKTVRSKLRKQLVADCNFLASMKIMDYSLLVGIHNSPTKWCTTTRVTSDEVSPQGSPRISVEIDSFPKLSFRKNWNLPPVNSPQYPSISIHADGGLSEQLSGDEADNEIESIPSAHSASWRPPLPPNSSRASSATSSSAPPMRLRRARSNSDSRLVTETRKVRNRNSKQGFILRPRPGLGSSKSSRHFANEGADEGNHAALPSVTLTPSRPAEPVVTIPNWPKHTRDTSVGSLKIPIDSILDSSDAASHNPYFSDDQTLSEQSATDQSVLHNIDVALHSDDDGSYLDDEREIPKDLSLSKEKLNNFIRNKEIMTERFFWPFHQLYTVQGKRRLSPSVPVPSTDAVGKGARRVTDSGPKFVPPISIRKDSGIEMDMSAFAGLPQDQIPNQKIYFVGIIDILQQFNSRKRVEARWRTLQVGREGASCVHPQLYADRFMRFFDEYTQRRDDIAAHNHKVNGDDNDYEGIEEVTFSRVE